MNNLNPDRSNSLDFHPIVFFGVCIDNKDPLLAGRIRAVEDLTIGSEGGRLTDPVGSVKNQTERAIKEGAWKPWGRKDPFLFSPFLPTQLNIIPKQGEAVKFIYYNPNNTTENREYIGPLIGQPHRIFKDDYRKGRLHTSVGTNVAALPQIIDSTDSVGVFPSPDDVSIVGRKNTDIVLGMSYKLPQPEDRPKEQAVNKKEQAIAVDYPQILIRSGKFIEDPKPQIASQPAANDKMTFIQLTTFPTTLTITEKEETKQVPSEDPMVYQLIEYDIANPLNVTATTDTVNCTINLYKLPSSSSGGTTAVFKASDMGIDGEFGVDASSRLMAINVPNKTAEGVKTIFKDFLQDFKDESWTRVLQPVSGESTPRYFSFGALTPDGLQEAMGNNAVPFYFRPGPILRNLYLRKNEASSIGTIPGLTQATYNTACQNVTTFVNSISVKASDASREGFGLVFSPEKNDIPTKEETKKTKDLNYEKPQEGVIVAGAEKIVLFSYNESTTGGTINLGGNYGMTQFTLVDDVMKKTSPMVRGDKLKDFLQEMMDFVGSHTHSCPGMAPDKNGTNSKKTDKDDIQKKLEEFDDKVLNQNLRIN
jgi:hypothetical protein